MTIYEIMQDEKRKKELEELKKEQEQMRLNIMSERDAQTVE